MHSGISRKQTKKCKKWDQNIKNAYNFYHKLKKQPMSVISIKSTMFSKPT